MTRSPPPVEVAAVPGGFFNAKTAAFPKQNQPAKDHKA